MSSDRPHAADKLGPYQLQLTIQEWSAMASLLGGWIPVTRRTAFEHIENINLVTFHLAGREDSIEQLPRAAYERLALSVFVGSRRFAQDAQSSPGIAHAKDRLSSGLGQFLTPRALDHFRAQHLERVSRAIRQRAPRFRFLGVAGTSD